jgi:hypothetical protein
LLYGIDPPLRAKSGREQAQHKTRTVARSFDHLVGAGEQCWRHVEAERVGSFEIDD